MAHEWISADLAAKREAELARCKTDLDRLCLRKLHAAEGVLLEMLRLEFERAMSEGTQPAGEWEREILSR